MSESDLQSGKSADSGGDLEDFEFKVYDLYSGVEHSIRDQIYTLAENLKRPELKGPLYAMTHELTVNALKALYKRVFYNFFVEEIGIDYVSYEEWLKLFKTELEVHQAENFARVCRQREMFVNVCGLKLGEQYRIQIENDGEPTEVEYRRLLSSIEKAKTEGPAAYYFEDDDDDDSNQEKEGGGIGLIMLITSLINLNIDPDNFQIITGNDRTCARLDLPLAKLQKN